MTGHAGRSASHALTWQIVDSAFPTGGFAHSAGLEAAWQSGEVPDRPALQRFVRASLLQTGYGVFPLVTAAFREPERLAELDALADAFLTNPVANRASRTQGRALVTTCARVWPGAAVTDLRAAAHPLCGHVAPLTAAAFQALGLPLWSIQEIVLFVAARGVLSAAVRLGMIGSYDAQRLQHDSAVDQAFVLDRCAPLGLDDLAQPSPLIDLWQASHDRLYSRLFQS